MNRALLIGGFLLAACVKARSEDAGERVRPNAQRVGGLVASQTVDAGVQVPEQHASDEEEDPEWLKDEFSVAYFRICKERDAGLVLMQQVLQKAKPGRAVHKEAREVIDQILDAGQ